MPPAGPPLGRRPVVLLFLATVALHASMLALSRVSDRRLASCGAPYAEPDAAIAGNAGKENAAFVMLMGPSALGEVRESLPRLVANVLSYHAYPVLLFVPEDVPYADAAAAEALPAEISGLELLLRVVRLTDFTRFPDHMEGVNISDPVQEDQFCPYPGYHLMCRWNFVSLLQHPEIRKLDYYCRLDTHSVVEAPVVYDMFTFLRNRGAFYGFVATQNEMAKFVTGLWDFIEAYIAIMPAQKLPAAHANGLPARVPRPGQRGGDLPGCVFNNFEVVAVQRFLQADVQHFVDTADRSHGQFRYRWGDAPLRYFTLLLFLDVATEVHQFKDIVYAHRHWLYINGLDFDFQKRGQLPDFGDLS